MAFLEKRPARWTGAERPHSREDFDMNMRQLVKNWKSGARGSARWAAREDR